MLKIVIEEYVSPFKKGKNGGFSDIRNELLSNPKINCDATKVIVESIVYILNSY
jgi:hypothetical protein